MWDVELGVELARFLHADFVTAVAGRECLGLIDHESFFLRGGGGIGLRSLHLISLPPLLKDKHKQ